MKLNSINEENIPSEFIQNVAAIVGQIGLCFEVKEGEQSTTLKIKKDPKESDINPADDWEDEFEFENRAKILYLTINWDPLNLTLMYIGPPVFGGHVIIDKRIDKFTIEEVLKDLKQELLRLPFL